MYSPAGNLRGTRDVSPFLSSPPPALSPWLSPHSFSVSYATTPAGSFRSVHFLLFSRLPPASDSWRSLNTPPPSLPLPPSSLLILSLALLANLFSKTVARSLYFPAHFDLLLPAEENSGALTIPDRQTRLAYFADLKDKTRFPRSTKSERREWHL